ncbi:hypothetical protein L226DRAFT_570895 [Lentinus tigrinus ALCF2SS1-7]|uniref:SUN domain-containing protein n=1 Tax=Lentinus tigrinus ALCF2SS1-6 TaxID=1328759 RepID=A0A5C2SBP0_9APHY|nr:hypothetical protein L227DRAFT_500949 [Lentinus tigrinus ALCF2SS1-6]RPD75244.1 hypothetical protein L226DRAFT_570895 [Lentinus tigrinus ALCF2SS1-7]
MSFSSTPLGQGRRLDHHTFLNKNNPNAAQRRAIPTSYSYGAPTVGSRSPPKPDKAPLPQEDDPEEPALVRFARLKQREQTSQAQPSRSVGPRTVASPPHPEKWSVRDTSVNIVSAITQAATSNSFDISAANSSNASGSNTSYATANNTAMNPNEAWASGIRKQPMVPRSTSVEYEKETQSTINRRLAPPPNRLSQQARVARPVSKTASVRHVPDSEGEEEVQPNGRAKTPLEQGYDFVRRVIPATFLLRERSQEPENSFANGNESARDQSSYDYSAEEREFQAGNGSQKPTSRRNVAQHRKNRMSTDNKAYRPTMSDLEESDEDFEEDGKRTRRKKKKTGPAGGPLTTLPVAGYDKRKKKKKGARGENGAAEDEEEGSSVEDEQASEQRSQRGTTPFQRAPSIARGSVPPLARQVSVPPTQYDSSGLNHSTDLEGGALSELEEIPPQIDGAFPPTKNSFSVGATLGRVVHELARAITWFFRTLVSIITSIPLALVRLKLHKYALAGISIWLAWRALNSGMLDLSKIPIPRGHAPVYHAPEIPAADLAALSARLQTLEKAFASLSLDSERSRLYIEGDAKHRQDVFGRIGSLETRVQKESIRAQDAESKFRASTSDGINAVKKEITQLSSQLQQLRDADARRPSIGSDDEARAKLKALEERVGTVEGGVKEAMELGKNAIKAGVVTGKIAHWWENVASGKTKGVTIKSSDGQDVTALIDQLVNRAVMRTSKDTLARVDFALHSGGARIIPSLTSETLEVRPGSLTGQLKGLLTGGNGYAIGRPPVTALHHEIHTGHCWPFGGEQGQLGVALAAPVYITDVTIDHVAKEVAMDMRSAPRQMELWGMVEGRDNVAKLREWRERQAEKREAAESAGQSLPPSPLDVPYPRTLPRNPEYVRVANFTYDIHASANIQTFPVHEEIKELGIDFGVVVLLVKSNWGKDEFTCLYRMRVHGERMGEVPLPYPEESA